MTSMIGVPSFLRLHRPRDAATMACSAGGVPRGRRDRSRAIWKTVPEIVLPNIKSAKKDMRKARAATIRNRAQRSALRTALKRASAPEATDEERVSAVTLLDRAARKGIIHKNAAARRKSRLAKAGK